jgi:hypothetical protein
MLELLCGKFIDEKTDLSKLVLSFSGMKMQIGFFCPRFYFAFDHRSLVSAFQENQIQIQSIHAPTLDVFDGSNFFKMLSVVRDIYELDSITIHPKSGDYFKGLKLIREYNENLWDEYKVTLMYENFDSSKGNKRWLPNAKMIARLPIRHPFAGLTYDTSHVKIGTDIVEDLKDLFPKLYMIHLSNKKKGANHLPLFEGEHDLLPVLEWIRLNYQSFIVLEYHNNDAKLIEDYRWLKNFLNQ